MAAWFVGVVLVLAVMTLVAWRFIDPSRGLDNAIALLIVTCPCALALSTPLAVSMAIGRAARAGIFVKGGDALERLASPGELLLDKTGTITEARTSARRVGRTGLGEAARAGSGGRLVASDRRRLPRAWPDSRHADAEWTRARRGRRHRSAEWTAMRGRRLSAISFAGERAVTAGHDSALASRALTPVWLPSTVRLSRRRDSAIPFGRTRRLDRAPSRAGLGGFHSLRRRTDVGAPSATKSALTRKCTGGATPESKLARVVALRGTASVRWSWSATGSTTRRRSRRRRSVSACMAGPRRVSRPPTSISRGRDSAARRAVDGARRTMRVIRRNVAFSIVYNVIGAGLAMTGHLTPLIAAI